SVWDGQVGNRADRIFPVGPEGVNLSSGILPCPAGVANKSAIAATGFVPLTATSGQQFAYSPAEARRRRIMKTWIRGTLLALLAVPAPVMAGEGFDVVALGARGGIQDGNLSAFLISPQGDGRAVTCDAGALVN